MHEIEYNNTKRYMSEKHWLKEKLIITIGSKGCKFKEKVFPVNKVEIKDLSGAGDTFLAALVFKFIETKDVEDSIIFANECATQVVQKKGVTTLNDI